MTESELSGQERTDLEITVCTNGVVNVHNPESDRAHSVMLDSEGDAVRCSCKGHRFTGHCYHTEEVETRPLVVASATASAANTGRQIATDGGTQQVVPTDDTDTDDNQTGANDDENRPRTDYWGHEVEHFSDEPVGAGEKSECQSCGERFEIAMIAATAENNRNWEEFYECQSCGARGSFRFHGETDRREWTGRIAYPD